VWEEAKITKQQLHETVSGRDRGCDDQKETGRAEGEDQQNHMNNIEETRFGTDSYLQTDFRMRLTVTQNTYSCESMPLLNRNECDWTP